jgi:hypothetical protein
LLYSDRIPFDFFWRKDLNDCRIILRKDGKVYAGAFFHLQPLEPVIDSMNLFWPENPCSIRKYLASWAEMLSVSEWFQGWFDLAKLKAQAEANNEISQRILGFLYANAWMEGTSYDTREENDKLAFYWLRRSLNGGDSHARTLYNRFVLLRKKDEEDKIIRYDGSTHKIYSELEYMPRLM